MKDKLHELLKHQKVLFVGMGNLLKSDDGIGVYLGHKLQNIFPDDVLIVELGLENYIGKIKNSTHEAVILLDAVNFNKLPGHFNLISIENLQDHTSNTHNISLKSISDMFKKPTYVLGIQPDHVQYGEGFTGAVKKAADKAFKFINEDLLINPK